MCDGSFVTVLPSLSIDSRLVKSREGEQGMYDDRMLKVAAGDLIRPSQWLIVLYVQCSADFRMEMCQQPKIEVVKRLQLRCGTSLEAIGRCSWVRLGF